MVDSVRVSDCLGPQRWKKTLALPIPGHSCGIGSKIKSEREGGTGRELAGEHIFCKDYSLCYDHSIFNLSSPKEVFTQSLRSSKMSVIASLAKNWYLQLLFLAILLNSFCSSVSTISCCLLYSSQFHRHGRTSCWHGEMTCWIFTFFPF